MLSASFVMMLLLICKNHEGDQGGNMTDESLSRASNKEIEEKALLLAIKELGPVTESAKFWTDIVNSTDYTKVHRRHCIFQLFRRHVSPGMRLSELAQILDNPNWLKDENVHVVAELEGKIPVQWTLEDTVFVFLVFPELPMENNWAVYLRISGKVDRESFIKLLRDQAVDQNIKDAVVLEIGFSDPQPSRRP
jgi:hypothetical protein